MKGAGCFWKFQEDWKIISVFPGSGATYTTKGSSSSSISRSYITKLLTEPNFYVSIIIIQVIHVWSIHNVILRQDPSIHSLMYQYWQGVNIMKDNWTPTYRVRVQLLLHFLYFQFSMKNSHINYKKDIYSLINWTVNTARQDKTREEKTLIGYFAVYLVLLWQLP